MAVNIVNNTCDKTWQEIHDAMASGTVVVIMDGVLHYHVYNCDIDEPDYIVYAYTGKTASFTADSANGYPARGES